MSPTAFVARPRSVALAFQDEAAGLLAGAGFTFALFLALAHVENVGHREPVTDIEEARVYAVPLEPPPPPPRVEPTVQTFEGALPLSGIEIGASDSPVSIAVVPPDLESVIPATPLGTRGRMQLSVLHADLRPTVDVAVDVGHVYQETEVDQKPRPLVRTVPVIPSDISASAPSLSVGLLLLIDQNGRVQSARVLQSSGNRHFDAIIARAVNEEWLFAPAVRRGKRVRVLAQQPFRMNFSGGSSPFTTGL